MCVCHEIPSVCHEIPVNDQLKGPFSTVTKFRCVRHEMIVCVCVCHEIPVTDQHKGPFSTVTKFECVRHEMMVCVSRNSGPHQPMGRGLTPALRRSRGIGAEIAISQHDHCSRRPPLRV